MLSDILDSSLSSRRASPIAGKERLQFRVYLTVPFVTEAKQSHNKAYLLALPTKGIELFVSRQTASAADLSVLQLLERNKRFEIDRLGGRLFDLVPKPSVAVG